MKSSRSSSQNWEDSRDQIKATRGNLVETTKRKFSTELAYVFGIVLVALGVVLMEKADFGVSMVVAPAYLLYRWLSPMWSFVTFGMAEYCLQAVLLVFGLWHFEGVKWGTIVCALINGWIIGRFSAFYEKHWSFYDRFSWRRFFEGENEREGAFERK